MITHVTIQNCKSIVNAAVTLSPFTLLIGANGSGKTNFLHILQAISYPDPGIWQKLEKHLNHREAGQSVMFTTDSGSSYSVQTDMRSDTRKTIIPELIDVRVFSLNPSLVGQAEGLTSNPSVQENGEGVVQVLDALKTGDREDLFEQIEAHLRKYIPEIERLSFFPQKDGKILQVREQHIKKPLPVSLLSEGTKFVIAILTILFQEHPPSLICIEEIDRGLHPRLFERVVRLCFDMARQENMPQIIATTHNPYIVDQFKDHEEAVIIVEKTHGETTFTSFAERMETLEPEGADPLGQLWFSGFVGGAPRKGGGR